MRRRDKLGRRSLEREQAVRNWQGLPTEYLDGEGAEALGIDNLDLPDEIRDALRLASYRQPADHEPIPDELKRVASGWIGPQPIRLTQRIDILISEWDNRGTGSGRRSAASRKRGIDRTSQRLALVRDLLTLV